MKGEKDNSIIVGDFSALILIINRKAKRSMRKQ
jgi:hypothetical protein